MMDFGMGFEWSFALVLVATSLLTALAALLITSFLPVWPRGRQTGRPGLQGEETVFLFDDEYLVDATPKARRFLSRGPDNLSDWNRLTALLTPRFPDFTAEMSRLAETGMTVLEETAGTALIRARWAGGIARITLHDPETGPEDAPIDQQSLAALNSELEILRRVVAHIPTLTWQQDSTGEVIWANRAYLKLVEETLDDGDELIWPLPRLFTGVQTGDDLSPRRLSIILPGGDVQWFDCSAFAYGDTPMYFALPADATVHAEASLRNFVQTLTKTFAGLPIGLAIFNRARQLVMFNPALVDLCMLEPQFLAARPSLFAFLDQLRDKHMIPEPKDYKSWRQNMTALEQDAANGVYEKTWSLPSGLTYRVSGRPHPDGAVAFLFEDISAEVSLTRRFRAELEMGQAVIDSLDEAIAIFSPAGVLTLSNIAYARLWDSDPAMTLSEIGIHDATRHWREKCGDAPLWDEARKFTARIGPREELTEQVALADGSPLICRLKSIAGGATLVGFSVPSDVRTQARSAEPAVSGAAV
ncbi:PAS-domain containing protein [Actibacterium sp. D379-3]